MGSRIKVDVDLEKKLEEIKAKTWEIRSSRGQVETIRFLADYYLESKSLEELLTKHMESLEQRIDESIKDLPASVMRGLIHLTTNFLNVEALVHEKPLPGSDRSSSRRQMDHE